MDIGGGLDPDDSLTYHAEFDNQGVTVEELYNYLKHKFRNDYDNDPIITDRSTEDFVSLRDGYDMDWESIARLSGGTLEKNNELWSSIGINVGRRPWEKRPRDISNRVVIDPITKVITIK